MLLANKTKEIFVLNADLLDRCHGETWFKVNGRWLKSDNVPLYKMTALFGYSKEHDLFFENSKWGLETWANNKAKGLERFSPHCSKQALWDEYLIYINSRSFSILLKEYKSKRLDTQWLRLISKAVKFKKQNEFFDFFIFYLSEKDKPVAELYCRFLTWLFNEEK